MEVKTEIKRTDLKTTFLRQMIIRLDYDYLFEEDIEKIVKESYKYLIENGYKMNSKTLSEFNINLDINNLEQIENNEIRINNNNNKEEYSSFIKNNVVIDITKNFATMTVDYEKFILFEQLERDFFNIAVKIINVREGLEIKRIGIRKINSYLFKSIDKINKYFEKGLFCIDPIIKENKVFNVKQVIENFMLGKYKVNEIGNISKGLITKDNQEQFDAYQVILDIDVYDDIVEKNEINLKEINELIFNIYVSALNIDFLEKLKKENYNDEEFIKI